MRKSVFVYLVNLGFRALRKILSVLLLLILSLPATAQQNGQVFLNLISSTVDSRLELGEVLLRSTVNYMIDHPEAGQRSGHQAVKSILNGSDVFRSIVSIDENGGVLYDSFNLLPFLPAADLSDRKYFRLGRSLKPKSMVVFDAIIARQSGLVSLPLVMATPSIGGGQRVAVLFVTPEKLLPQLNLCNTCGVVMFKDGKVLAASHQMSVMNEAIADRVEFNGAYGSIDMNVRSFDLTLHWKRSSRSGLVFVYYESKTSTP